MKRVNKLDRREMTIALLFVLPPLLGFLIFTLVPTVFSMVFSLSDFNPILETSSFVGLRNFKELFTHPVYSKAFFTSIYNTVFMMLGMPIRLAVALVLAAIVNSKTIRFKKFFKIVFYLPAVSSAVALSIIWRYIFNGEYGVLNYVLNTHIYWIGDNATLVKVAVIIKNVWGGIGSTMIMFLAGMLGVSPDYYEAADLDGANSLQKFFHVTMPMLGPITAYLVTMGVINGLQNYADAVVFAQGNEGARTVVHFIWFRGIEQMRYGIASAASLFLAVTIMVLTAIQFKHNNKWIDEV